MNKIFLLIMAGSLFSSCALNKRFDFKSAYKFKYVKYGKLTDNDSMPSLVASADKRGIIQQQLNIKHLNIQDDLVTVKSRSGSQVMKISGQQIRHSKSVKEFRTKGPVSNSGVSSRHLKMAPHKKAIKGTSGFHDLHPALQGFLIVVLGFGVVLAGALLGSLYILSTILIIGGLVIAGFGFYLIVKQI
jgi:hypothetical protein